MLRRDFLKATLAATTIAPILMPCDLFAQSINQPTQVVPTILWAKRGNDEAQVDYATPEGYRTITWLLRDIRANQSGHPDFRLLQLLSWMQAWLSAYGHHTRFDLHSGLRTAETNRKIEGAAQASFHLPDARGMFRAADFSTATISNEYMGRLAYLAHQGGVGFYAAKHFTHVDTGGLRHWRK